MTPPVHRWLLTPTARRVLTEGPPRGRPDAAAAEFVTGPLLAAPCRVAKAPVAPFEGSEAPGGGVPVLSRVDEAKRAVVVVDAAHRRDAYRGRS